MRPEEKLPLLTGLNDRTFSMNDAIRKVNITFGDEVSAILIADSSGPHRRGHPAHDASCT